MNKHKGFTIVELLIVIVIIGILAAISIVAYSGISEKARDSTVQSDLNGASKALGIYVAQYSVPTSAATLSEANISATKNAYRTGRHNFYYCTNRNTGAYAIGAVTKDDHFFIITSTGGLRSAAVSNATAAGVCQTIGLTDNTETNAYYSIGYNNTTKTWASWVK